MPPFVLLPLKFRLSSTNLRLARFSGPLWRSALGAVLQRHFPGAFAVMFGKGERAAPLHALAAPVGHVAPGQEFELRLTLFGALTEHAIACAQTVMQMGEMGIGEARGRFSALDARVADGGSAPFLSTDGLGDWPKALSADAWLSRRAENVNGLTLRLLSPLRVKDKNEVLTGPFSFAQWMHRLHGRIAQVAEAAGSAMPVSEDRIAAQLEAAKDVALVGHALERVEQKRCSARSGQRMLWEGIVGELEFRGPVAPFAGVLALAKTLQVGGKTAFGLGHFDVLFSCED
jgi:hypothetical protein